MKKILLNKLTIKLLMLALAISMLLPSCAVRGDKDNIIPDKVTSGVSEPQSEAEGTLDPETTSGTEDVVVGVDRPSMGAVGDNESSDDEQSSVSDTEEAETSSSLPDTEESESSSSPEDPPESSETVETEQVDVFVPYDVPLSVEQQKTVERIAAKYGVNEELVFGVMKVESKYNVNAVGKDGKYLGIMQVAKSNLSELSRKAGVTNLMDFEQCVTAGCYYLKQYGREAGGNTSITLLYYHGGYRYANNMLKKGQTEDSYTRAVIKELNRIVEARKKLATEMGVTLTDAIYK